MSLALLTAALLNSAGASPNTLAPYLPEPLPTVEAPSVAGEQASGTEVAIAITYREQLQGALSVGEWEEANRLTSIVLLQSAKQYGRGYLIAKDIRALPCKTLQEVDYWWTNSSNGHFGLSAQANLWHQMKGKTFDDVTKFENRIGWLGPVDFLSTVTAPKAHLPLRPVKPTGMPDAWGGGWIQEMPRRLIACGVIKDPNPPKPKPKPPAAKPATPAKKPKLPPVPKPKPAPAPSKPQPQMPEVRLRDILPPVEPRR